MQRLSTLVLATLLGFAAQAQTSDLVFFSDDGAKFTLLVDGDQKNPAPTTRVIATGIRTETPMVIINFEDKGITAIRKSGYFPLGKEYTVMITTNKKGERVLRPTGEAALGTAASAEPVKERPAGFQDDPVEQTSATQTVGTGDAQSTTTTTVIEQQDADGENMNMSMGVNGLGVSMSVNVDDGMGGTGTTTSTTTTTTTTVSQTTSSGMHQEVVEEQPVQQSYSMPGYSGAVGCPWPMNPGEFTDLKGSIESKSFEESKMTLAKQVAGSRCFTVDQVKGVMGLFSFEDSKLDFAKFAYDHTYDISNYYKVNDAFTFESSIEDLNEYIQSR